MIEELELRALHVEAMRAADLHAEHQPHVLFQASTIGSLLDGAYDGEVSFAELAGHGDTGLGTLDALDGEMIALDGHFYRADRDGVVNEIAPTETTPFAVVGWLRPTAELVLDGPLAQAATLARVDELLGTTAHRRPEAPACLLRIDGEFESVTARSVPRQQPPYRPLAEVIAAQNVFEIGPCAGTLIGFRFPDYSEGIEVAGYHLHFIDRERSRGGHVLDFRLARGTVRADPSSDLHLELPAGLELTAPDLTASTHQAITQIEH